MSNWKYRYRYASMDKDTFFCGDGVMSVGDEFHPMKDDYRAESDLGNGQKFISRGGTIELPNKHIVSISWGNRSYSDNNRAHIKGNQFNEHPRTAEVGIIIPNNSGDDLTGTYLRSYKYQTTEQAKELIRRAKEL